MLNISHPIHPRDILAEVKAILFDMDGVIVFNTEFHKIALQSFCKSKGFELSESDMAEKIYGRTNREWILNLLGKDLEEDLIKAYATEKEFIYRELYKNHISAAPGIEMFLKKIKTSGVPLAIGTSAPPENVEFTLTRTNLKEYFSEIVDDTMISKSKPDPEIYLKAAERLGVKADECLVFEDSKSGILAGLNAGAKVIALSSTLSLDELYNLNPHAVIDDFHILMS